MLVYTDWQMFFLDVSFMNLLMEQLGLTNLANYSGQ